MTENWPSDVTEGRTLASWSFGEVVELKAQMKWAVNFLLWQVWIAKHFN